MPGPFNIPRLELDPTGSNINNRIQDEPHTLNTDTVLRAVAPNYGPFFNDSVIVKDSSGNILTLGVDYQIVELHQEATLKYGKAISSVILIINQSIGPNITITYQALGGHYAYDDSAIANIYQAIMNANNQVDWGSIINRPLQYPPSPHLHLLGDVIGFEYIVDYLERIKQALTLGHTRLTISIISNLYSNLYSNLCNNLNSNLANLDNLSSFSCGKEILKILPTTRHFTHDAFLYFITRKKVLYNIWVDTKDCKWYKGDSAVVQVDTSGYPADTTLYWSFYKPENSQINLFSTKSGTIKSNGGIVEFNVYTPSADDVSDRPIYIGVKDNLSSVDFKAVTYRINIIDHTTSDEVFPLIVKRVNTSVTDLNLALLNRDDDEHYLNYSLTAD